MTYTTSCYLLSINSQNDQAFSNLVKVKGVALTLPSLCMFPLGQSLTMSFESLPLQVGNVIANHAPAFQQNSRALWSRQINGLSASNSMVPTTVSALYIQTSVSFSLSSISQKHISLFSFSTRGLA